MPYVEISGNVRDHGGKIVPVNLQPELWFRPNAPVIIGGSAGMLLGVEAKADLTAATGAYTVQLFSGPGISYTPVYSWLSDPSQADQQIENRARGYMEFPTIWPGQGGPIGSLPQDPIQVNGWFIGHGPPPDYLAGALYLNISGSASGGAATIYAPKGSVI